MNKLRDSNLKKNIGNLVSLTTSGGVYFGKIIDVNGREIIMNPHRGFRYNEGKKCNLYEMVKEDSFIEVSPHGYYIEPLTQKTLDYFIKTQNEELIKEKEKHEKEKLKDK